MDCQFRVCLIPPADLLPDSGSTKYSRALANSLAAGGCDVTLICSRPHESIQVPVIVAPIPLVHPFDHHQGIPGRVFGESIQATLAAIQTEWGPRPGDIIHAVYAGYTAIAGGIAAALSESSLVVSELGRMVHVAAPGEGRYRRMVQLALLCADHVIAATPDIADTIERDYRVPRSSQTIISVPQDISAFQAAASPRRSAAQRGDIVITTICSCLTEEKGVLDLLKAFAEVQNNVKIQSQLCIVGKDPRPGEPFRRLLESRIARLGLAGRVRLSGYQPHDRIPHLLAESDIYVDPRRVSNVSSVIAEAMAMQRPVLASSVASNAALIEDGVDALLFEAGSVSALAEGLKRLCQDGGLRNRLASQGPAWVARRKDQLSYQHHAERIIGVYRTLGNGCRG